jgi:two-component system OmpR family sensor kinase
MANPVLHLRAGLSALVVGGGTALSVLLAIAFGLEAWQRRARQASAAQARAAASDDRRRFLRRLDHELKNPLTATWAALGNLAEASDATRKEALVSLSAQLQRISHLVANLRKLADLETRAIERTAVDMTALLQEALVLAQDLPEATDRHLTLTLPPAPRPLSTIYGDRDLLALAVYNLLDNAIKFSSPGDSVSVKAFEQGARMIIEVADTGPGIPEAEVPHVWKELYRTQGAQGVPGNGLGLALVRAIVDGHGGQVTLRSRVGEGTAVTMILPLHRSVSAPTQVVS